MSINNEWGKVRMFHEAFGHPYRATPSILSKQRVEARNKWMLEEIEEFVESEKIEDQADAMIDLIYFALGTLVEMGIKPEKLFDIVHEANMSKLWPDGKPHFNEDGKVIKPSNWVDPEPLISDAISKETAAV